MSSPASTSAGRISRAALEAARDALLPGTRSVDPPDLPPICDWLDEHYKVNGAPWVTRSYQRAWLEAMVDPDIPSVVIIKSSRLGYTKALVGMLAYRIANDPMRALIAQPTQEDYEGFSKEDLQPGFDECDAIAHLIRPRTREGDNTTALKKFPGGWIRCGGSHTGRTFRRIEPDVAIGDEVDAWPASAGTEGDQIELMKRRLQSVPWPKMILGSSPLVKGSSRIEKAFRETDQRYFFVPCPHCDHGQRLRWGGPDCDYGFKFSTESPEEARRTAYYLCEQCHQPIDHREHQAEMVEHGEWTAGHLNGQGEWEPGGATAEGKVGFHAWAAYSPDLAVSWGNIAAEFVTVRNDPLRFQPFVNTVLGETWEHRGRSPNAGLLFQRREPYPSIEVKSDAPGAEPQRVLMVPRGGVVLTAMVDGQIDRLEAGIEAWGLGQENWKLEYRVFYGDPTSAPVWQALWEWLIRPRELERGSVDFVRSTCIDTGYAAQAVAEFVRPRQIYRTADRRLAYLWATKGDDGPGPVWPQKPSQSKWKCPLYVVKVNTAKDAISQRGAVKERGPGHQHWPIHEQFPEGYFRQYGAEHRLDGGGWEKKAGHDRNEAWDVAVGNYAALCALFAVGLDLDTLAMRIARAPAPQRHEPAEAAPPAMPAAATPKRRQQRTTRSNYVTR